MGSESRRVRLSPLARDGLAEIWLYTAKTWSTAQAERYCTMILEATEALARNHIVGRRTTVRAGYRKFGVGSHVIFFRTSDSALDVIRILHRRMDVERHL